jgi:two-component system, NtrC family, sensor kinase
VRQRLPRVESFPEKITRPLSTLTGKFIGVGITAVAAVALVLHFSIVEEEKRLLIQREEKAAVTLANAMRLPFTQILLYEETGFMREGGLLDLYISRMMANRDIGVVYAMVLDPDGWVLSHSDLTLFQTRPVDPLTRAALSSSGVVLNYVGDPFRSGVLDVSVPLSVSSRRFGTLRIGYSLAELSRSYAALKRKALALTASASGAMILVLLVTAKILARPIRRLAGALNSVHLGSLAAVPLPERRDEIGDLQKSYRIMVDRLSRQEEERERTRELIMNTEKMASVGMISAGIAHEINNPLTGAMHGVEALSRESLPPEKREQYMGILRDSLGRIRRAVSQLLEYSTVHAPNFSDCDVSRAVERVLSLLSYPLEKNGIAVDNRIPTLTVRADAHKLEQVLVNLVLNAVAAMPGGGRLTLRHRSDDGFLTLVIEDTGEGIPAEHLGRIFDPFFTTKGIGKGTGLGLAVCKKIVDQHGGRISVESPQGEGACFHVSLPYSPPPGGNG